MAQIIQLDDVLEACSAFLQSQLHPSNALGIRSFADLHNCRDLLLQAQAYIDQHFELVLLPVVKDFYFKLQMFFYVYYFSKINFGILNVCRNEPKLKSMRI